MLVRNRCECGGAKLKSELRCAECLALVSTVDQLVKVSDSSPSHRGKIGWVDGTKVAGTGPDSARLIRVRLNHNGTRWIAIDPRWLEPMRGEERGQGSGVGKSSYR